MGTADIAGQRDAVRIWWRDAVVYQIYIRSFADGNGDGIGDIAGIRDRLGYLHDLGIDALWINPWYPSPMTDGGYDVADYRGIEPMFGTIEEASALFEEAHALGLRVLLDIVPNHTSDQHPWFQAALASLPGSAERALYHFRPGRGPDDTLPPNDWRSVFGGPAWTRTPDGEWYLHLFDGGQPDLNWANERVHAEFESILRFWFDRGVDGFRIDAAHGLAKSEGLPDLGLDEGEPLPAPGQPGHPHWDLDEVHEPRAVADPAAGRPGARTAGIQRLAGRTDRRPGGLRDGRVAAAAPARLDRRLAAGIPPHLSGRGRPLTSPGRRSRNRIRGGAGLPLRRLRRSRRSRSRVGPTRGVPTIEPHLRVRIQMVSAPNRSAYEPSTCDRGAWTRGLSDAHEGPA
jgi:hypothetical protein